MKNGSIVRSSKRNYDYDMVDGLHEALIDEKTYYLAQKIMKENRPTAIRWHDTLQTPFAGLLICEKCGHKRQRKLASVNYSHDIIICTYKYCDNIGSDISVIENKMLSALDEWLKSYQLDQPKEPSFNSDIILLEQQYKTIDSALKNLDKQIDNLYDLLEQGVYDVDTFLKRSKKLSSKKDNLQSSLIELTSKITYFKNNNHNKYYFLIIFNIYNSFISNSYINKRN